MEGSSRRKLGDGPEPAAHGRQDVSAYAAIRCCLLNRFTQNSWHTHSWKIQEGCINKVAEKLTINTIRYWLPNLYPTDFQKGEQSLVKLKATIANADGINSGVRALEKNLTSSNATLQQLSKVSDSIQQASHKFDQSTDKITKLKVGVSRVLCKSIQ